MHHNKRMELHHSMNFKEEQNQSYCLIESLQIPSLFHQTVINMRPTSTIMVIFRKYISKCIVYKYCNKDINTKNV